MQQLDAAALRRLAGEADEITWLLKMDQMSESLEATLLKLRDSLVDGITTSLIFGDPPEDNLSDQISSIKTSADIDKSVEQLAAQNLKIYGGTYVFWDKEQARGPYGDYPLPLLRYTSKTKAVLSITPEDKNNSTASVVTGWEPPQNFIESELAGIDRVEVDHRQVWSRSSGDDDGEIPF